MSGSKRDEERFEHLVLQNSVERVINTTLKVLAEGHWRTSALREDADTASQDWKELKSAVTRVWNEERNRIFIKRQETQRGPR